MCSTTTECVFWYLNILIMMCRSFHECLWFPLLLLYADYSTIGQTSVHHSCRYHSLFLVPYSHPNEHCIIKSDASFLTVSFPTSVVQNPWSWPTVCAEWSYQRQKGSRNRWSLGTYGSGNLPLLVITNNLQNVTMLQPIVNVSWSCWVQGDTEA